MNGKNAASLQAGRLLEFINTGQDPESDNPVNNVNGTSIPGRGREYIHSLYPNEIEYYACAFELVDGDDNTMDFFSFPIMPKNYSSSRRSNVDIQKTMAGVVITNNPTFIPFDINMSGTFGRKFKRIQTTPKEQRDFSYDIKTESRSGIKNNNSVFSTEYKTGYGCYKILESIILRAQKQDGNYNPYKLYFYNLSLNYNFLVEPISITSSQNRDNSNGIWEYNLQLKAVAPAVNVNKNYRGSLKSITDFSRLIQQSVFQSNEIEEYKKEREIKEKKFSKVEKIILRQAQGRVLGLLSNQGKSVIQAMIELTAEPGDLDDFLINVGDGILARL